MRAACPPKATDYAIAESLMYSRGIKNKKKTSILLHESPRTLLQREPKSDSRDCQSYLK